MPRVTDEYRRSRRLEIARAALRCLERKGVHDTSIADVVEESGLSTGAIYSHFSSKAELARFIVAEFLIVRVDAFEEDARAGRLVTPRDALRRVISTFTEEGLPAAVVVQFWGEATVDPELNAEMQRTSGRLRAGLTSVLRAWAQDQDAGSADALASATAGDVMALAQGFIASAALFGLRDADDYLRGVTAALR